MSDSVSTLANSQSAIREAAKTARAQMTVEQRQQASVKIAERVLATNLFNDATRIACYVPMQTEVDTWPIIKRAWQLNKRIFAPVIQKNYKLRFQQFDSESELFTGPLGLQEPRYGQSVDANSLHLVLLPLVAFDLQRNRIGMGGGYYDRAFSFLSNSSNTTKPVLAGLAFDCQNIEKIIPNPWDIRLFRLFTQSTSL